MAGMLMRRSLQRLGPSLRAVVRRRKHHNMLRTCQRGALARTHDVIAYHRSSVSPV